MADRGELEVTTTKRARLSLESSFDQNDSSVGDPFKVEPQDSSISRYNVTEEGASEEKLPTETMSREQCVGHVGHERLESEDFPTCYSVEDGLENQDEHHYQPIAGKKKYFSEESSSKVNVVTFFMPAILFFGGIKSTIAF